MIKLSASLADRIDDILPQTQCGKCGYPACRPYAEAIANGEAGINQCPPGGVEGIALLADLLGVAFQPFGDDVVLKPKSVACIDENRCIGCTLCLQACPVDAIAGAAKLMHTVIIRECTGCELCISPCPVDCISMRPLASQHYDKAAARERYRFRQERIARDKREKAEKLAYAAKAAPDAEALIQAALERARVAAAAVQPRNIGQLTPAQQEKIAAIEARRARANLSPDAAAKKE